MARTSCTFYTSYSQGSGIRSTSSTTMISGSLRRASLPPLATLSRLLKRLARSLNMILALSLCLSSLAYICCRALSSYCLSQTNCSSKHHRVWFVLAKQLSVPTRLALSHLARSTRYVLATIPHDHSQDTDIVSKRNFSKVMRSALAQVRGRVPEDLHEQHQRRRELLALYRWTGDGTGLAL